MGKISCESQVLEISESIFQEALNRNRHREAEIMLGISGEEKHARSVLGWVKQLTNTPSLALKIAALFHDVDRLINPEYAGGFKGDRNSKEYTEHKKAHAARSAGYICTRLEQCKVDPKILNRVKFLISHHDDTGKEISQLDDEELEVLVTADSLTFFGPIALKILKKEGESRLMDKARFMITKMPHVAREKLSKITLENGILNKIKNEIIQEVEISSSNA